MKRYIVVLCLVISLTGCREQNNETAAILDKAEECIEQHPDSSLRVLNTLQLNNIPDPKDKARYALLKSMALDKNYIDVTNDSLTSIALSYYKKYGTPDEKLKAYYYNGNVKNNSGEFGDAIENYISAEKNVSKSSDFVAIARLYNAKMWIYKSIYDIDKAIGPAELCADYFLQAKDTVKYIRALNTLSSMQLAADRFEDLECTLRQIKSLENMMTLSHKNAYYLNIINYGMATDNSSLKDAVDEYLDCFANNENIVDWIILAKAFNELGEYSSALAALDKYKLYNEQLDALYYFIASQVYNSVGNYEDAYNNLQLYQSKTSKEDLKIFRNDAKFVEERYYREEQQLKQKYFIMVLTLSIILILMIVFAVYMFLRNIIRRRNEKLVEIKEQNNILKDQYEKAVMEQNKLRSLIAMNKLSKDVIRVLEERMIILNNFVVSDISGIDMKESLQGLRNYLKDNENFMNSTRLSFEVVYPKFISYLKKKGLSQWEIACCCLYCIGLNGSEISNFLEIKYFYKQSSVIRKKLNVQSVNIDKFLLEKFRELS